MATDKDKLTVGSVIPTQNTTVPWPNYWPNYTQPYNNIVYSYPSLPAEKYANEVEVEQGEHDATLRFYRTRDKGRSLVHEVTVPLGVLERMQGKSKAKPRIIKRSTSGKA